MRDLTRKCLWLFVASMAWDLLTLPFVGVLSRLLGMLVVGVAGLTVLGEGKFRKPEPILVLATAFVVVSSLSLSWTVSYPITQERIFTYVQLLLSAWVVREFIQTPEQRAAILVAFMIGAFVPLIGILQNFGAQGGGMAARRFSAPGFNADDIGLMLVIGIPVAWYLLQHKTGLVRMMGIGYFVAAPIGVLVTGTRGAFLAGVTSLSIVPLTLPSQSVKTKALMTGLGVVLVVAVIWFVPSYTWTRILSIGNEVQGGEMTGRKDIWATGWMLFQSHKLLGVGAGAYGAAVEPYLYRAWPSHNVPLGILVEGGLLGFMVFASMLGACVWTIFKLPSDDRKLWGVLMLTWFVGVQSLSWETRKVTWLLFGLLASQTGAALNVRRRRDSASSFEPEPLAIVPPARARIRAVPPARALTNR